MEKKLNEEPVVVSMREQMAKAAKSNKSLRLLITETFATIYEQELQRIKSEVAQQYASQFRTEGASTVPTDEEVRKACPEDCLSDWILGAKWMREKMLKAKGVEDKVLYTWKNQYESLAQELAEKDKELEELKAEISVLHEMNNGYAKEREELKAERKETISVLWELCKDFGDNDWEEDLHMADIIDKHLSKRLYYEQTLQSNNTLSKEKVLDILEHYFGKGVKNSGRHHLCAEAICQLSLPNAATSAEAVKKAIEALEEMLYDVSINAHMTSKINKALSILKQSNK